MTRTAAGLFALALTLSAAAARADSGYISPTDERVRLSLGVSLVSAATSVRVDSSAGIPGTFVGAESDLGLQRTQVDPKFQIMLRAGARNRLRFDYFSLDRNATKVIAAPIAFRNVTLQGGDPVQTDLSLRALGITYGYSFWRTEKLEIAGTFGINAIDISARAKVETPTRHINESDDQAGPFPTLGIDATWVASRRFYFDGRVQYLKLAVNQLRGALGIYELDALYRFRPNVSFALGYSEVKATLNSTQAAHGGRSTSAPKARSCSSGSPFRGRRRAPP